MKILQLNTVYKTGSTGKIVKDLNDLIIKNGYESLIAYGRGEHKDKNSIKIGNRFDKYFHGIGTRVFDRHGFYSKKATTYFIKKIDKLDVDVFHLHNIHGYYLHYPTLFKYLKDKKVIWTLHDCWSFTGHCSYYDYIGCFKWQSVCERCPQKMKYPASLIVDNSKNNFILKQKHFTSLKNLTIVTPSNWLAGEVKKSFLKRYPVKVINNGIDLDVFKPVKTILKEKLNLENKFIILGVANVWEERKGFNYFIKLSKMLSDNEKIILVGLNGKQQSRLPQNILGIKRTNNLQELVEFYNIADVFVNPTLEDNFPTTNIESVACGTPIVTFGSGGSPETIDENSGIVVKKGDLYKLYEAIQEIKQIGKENMGIYCINRAKRFNKNERFEEYIELYRSLI